MDSRQPNHTESNNKKIRSESATRHPFKPAYPPKRLQDKLTGKPLRIPPIHGLPQPSKRAENSKIASSPKRTPTTSGTTTNLILPAINLSSPSPSPPPVPIKPYSPSRPTILFPRNTNMQDIIQQELRILQQQQTTITDLQNRLKTAEQDYQKRKTLIELLQEFYPTSK